MFKLFSGLSFKFQVIICLLSIVNCQLSIVNCQVSGTLTMEMEAKSGSENYNIIPLAEKGLLVFYENNDRHSNNIAWVFAKYDTVFKKVWNKEINISSNFDYAKSYYDSKLNQFYILLLKTTSYQVTKSSENNGNFAIISLNLSNGEYKIIKGMIPARAAVSQFMVIDNNAYIGGNSSPTGGTSFLHSLFSITFIPMFTGLSFYKFKPVIVNVNLLNGNAKLMPNIYKGNAYMLNEQISGQSDITTINKNVVSRTKSYLCLNTYNSESNLIKAVQIIIPSDSILVSVKSFRIGNNNFLTGKYKYKRRHRIIFNPFYRAANELSLTSDGLFFSKIVNDKPEFIKFYNFRNFQSFYNALIKSQKSKVKNQKFNTDYQLLLHDVIQRGDEYILVGEVYHPEYHLEYFWTMNIYGQLMQESREVFDGYKYTHAIITAFDNKGNLLWDNSFEIGNILTFNLKQRVKVMFDEDDIVLAYSNEGKIASTIIHKNQVIQAKEEEKLENVKHLVSSDIDFWYKNYFITFGYKTVSDDNTKNKNTTTTFYFSKIAFQ